MAINSRGQGEKEREEEPQGIGRSPDFFFQDETAEVKDEAVPIDRRGTGEEQKGKSHPGVAYVSGHSGERFVAMLLQIPNEERRNDHKQHERQKQDAGKDCQRKGIADFGKDVVMETAIKGEKGEKE